MGNRAVVAFSDRATLGKNYPKSDVGIYLHWNGGEASILGFCDAAKTLGIPNPAKDSQYGIARFAQMICNYFGGTLSVGIGVLRELDCDNGDNGMYVIGPDWQIVGRYYTEGRHEVNPEKTATIAADCIAKYPRAES